jgi:hypothetical protein
MQSAPVQDHEAAHLDNLRRLDESDRELIYELARRWRVRRDRHLGTTIQHTERHADIPQQ